MTVEKKQRLAPQPQKACLATSTTLESSGEKSVKTGLSTPTLGRNSSGEPKILFDVYEDLDKAYTLRIDVNLYVGRHSLALDFGNHDLEPHSHCSFAEILLCGACCQVPYGLQPPASCIGGYDSG